MLGEERDWHFVWLKTPGLCDVYLVACRVDERTESAELLQCLEMRSSIDVPESK